MVSGLAVQAKSCTSSAWKRCVRGAVAVVLARGGGAGGRGRRRRIGRAAGGAHHEARRHGDGDVVDAVIGKELGGGVELVRVPALVLQHAQLGEPLGDEVVVAHVAGARDRLRHLGGPLDVHFHAVPWRHRLIQRHAQHGAVVLVAVVGSDELRARLRLHPGAVGRGAREERRCRSSRRTRGAGPAPRSASAHGARWSHGSATRSSRGGTAARWPGGWRYCASEWRRGRTACAPRGPAAHRCRNWRCAGTGRPAPVRPGWGW